MSVNPLNLYTSENLKADLAKGAGDKPAPLDLDDQSLGQLLGILTDVHGPNSPVKDIPRQKLADPEMIKLLFDKGWLIQAEDKQDKLRTNPDARGAVQALLNPKTRIQLILGGMTELAITELYSADGYKDDALVIYSHKEQEGRHIIHPSLSPSDVSDALLAHLIIGPREGLVFEQAMRQDLMLPYLTVLDLIYARRLEAKLRSDLFPELTFTADDLLVRFAEIRLGEDLMWLSALLPYLFPYIQSEMGAEEVPDLLGQLAEEGLLTPLEGSRYQPNDFSVALSEALLPTFAYASLAIVNTEEEGLHLAFLVGQNVNLVVKVDAVDGDNLVGMTGMDVKQFSKILFDLGLPESE